MRTLASATTEQPGPSRGPIVQGSPGLRAYKVEHQRGWDEALVAGLERRSRAAVDPLAPTTSGSSPVSMAAFRAAFETWLANPGTDFPGVLDEAFAQLARGLT